jgi:hypothetical protein
MKVDASIDALVDALGAAGVDPPRAPSNTADLDAVDAAIAPMSLPGQVRRFWERVDPGSLRVWAYPHPTTVSFALDTWKQHRDEFPGMVSQALFLVGYESWACMSVELDSPLGSGGAMFEWRLDGSSFYLRYHDLSSWLDRITELVVAGEFERRPEHPESHSRPSQLIRARAADVAAPLAAAVGHRARGREAAWCHPHNRRAAGVGPVASA